jgi:hypothetical protein
VSSKASFTSSLAPTNDASSGFEEDP